MHGHIQTVTQPLNVRSRYNANQKKFISRAFITTTKTVLVVCVSILFICSHGCSISAKSYHIPLCYIVAIVLDLMGYLDLV